MGDMKSLANARMELEELYLGIPDDSVNLTFQDLANVKDNANAAEKKKPTSMEYTIQQAKNQASPLNKLPSLDFKRGLQESKNNHHHHHLDLDLDLASHGGHKFESHSASPRHHHHLHHGADGLHDHHRYGYDDHRPSHHGHAEFRCGMENSRAYDDRSMNSMYEERGGRARRPGIPHSNICTICSTYIYIFRHRCLVCGRVYCRSCVSIGMGEMTEGRKCIQCLGKRFSHRYIERAGKVGCCSRYPSTVKQAELRWAEKGPKRSGEKGYGHSSMVSRSVNPTRPHIINNNTSPSFVSSLSPHSPYSAHHHHFPL